MPPIIPLTIVIPSFGRQPGVERALASIVEQTVWPQQTLVVDDGSIPPLTLPSLPQGFAVDILRQPQNKGAAAARNLGMYACETPWVSFLDSDDWLVPVTLHQRWKKFRETVDGNSDGQRTILACGWTEVTEKGEPIGIRHPLPSRSSADFATGCWFSPGSCVILNVEEALRAAGGQDEMLRRYEDFDWFLALGIAGFRLQSQPIVGANVTRARNVAPSLAAEAASRIAEKWDRMKLTRQMRRAVRSYMALEIAAANHYAGNQWRSFACLAKSFLLVPRVSLQLSPGWLSHANSRTAK